MQRWNTKHKIAMVTETVTPKMHFSHLDIRVCCSSKGPHVRLCKCKLFVRHFHFFLLCILVMEHWIFVDKCNPAASFASMHKMCYLSFPGHLYGVKGNLDCINLAYLPSPRIRPILSNETQNWHLNDMGSSYFITYSPCLELE